MQNRNTIASILDNLLLLIILRIGLLLAGQMNPPHTLQVPSPQPESKTLIVLLKAITLANVVKFFLLPIMIWNNHTGDMEKNFNYTLVMGYFIYGLIHVFSGRIRMSQFSLHRTLNIICLHFSFSGVEPSATYHRRIDTDYVGNKSDIV